MKILKSVSLYITLALVALVAFGGYYTYGVYKDFKPDDTNNEPPDINQYILKQSDRYNLYEDTTDYQKSIFDELIANSVVVGQSTPEQEASFAESYAKNFAADFLTLGAKNVDLDRVGGEQFIADYFKEKYYSLNGVEDYYFSRDYYVFNFPETYSTTLPNISNLELTDYVVEPIYYNDGVTEVEDLYIYTFNYNVYYENPNETELYYFTNIDVSVTYWNDQWTVMEFKTDEFNDTKTLIRMW